MEGINSPESFEGFKNRIVDTFKAEGVSENLNLEIDRWHARRQQETDLPGGTIEQRVVFQIELAQIYIVIGKNDSAFDTLNDARAEADQEGLTNLVQNIENIMRSIS